MGVAIGTPFGPFEQEIQAISIRARNTISGFQKRMRKKYSIILPIWLKNGLRRCIHRMTIERTAITWRPHILVNFEEMGDVHWIG